MNASELSYRLYQCNVIACKMVMRLHKIMVLTVCNASTFQDFCKDWAEQMIVSVVLVCSEPLALHMLHSKQHSRKNLEATLY